MKFPIYMDNHATTPMDPRVFEAMAPFFLEQFGNAASRHHDFGLDADRAVEQARDHIASLIGCEPDEIVFTSGATESDNLALKGVAEAYRCDGDHIITAVTEHSAVLDTCRYLEKNGFEVTYLPVDSSGLVSSAMLESAIREGTILVSIMMANNEIGVLQPVKELATVARERGVLFHSDAVQALGKVPLNVRELGLDLASLTAHKIYGPKGCGALYVKRRGGRVQVNPQVHGGGHERGVRSGTLNVPGIVGFGKACEIAGREMGSESRRIGGLRDRLRDGLTKSIPDVEVNGHPTQRLPNNLNVRFSCVEAEALLMELRDIAISSGAACTSTSVAPSHVLKALGLSDEQVYSSVRFGLGRFNTEEEIDYVIQRVGEAVERLRSLSPAWRELHPTEVPNVGSQLSQGL